MELTEFNEPMVDMDVTEERRDSMLALLRGALVVAGVQPLGLQVVVSSISASASTSAVAFGSS